MTLLIPLQILQIVIFDHFSIIKDQHSKKP